MPSLTLRLHSCIASSAYHQNFQDSNFFPTCHQLMSQEHKELKINTNINYFFYIFGIFKHCISFGKSKKKHNLNDVFPFELSSFWHNWGINFYSIIETFFNHMETFYEFRELIQRSTNFEAKHGNLESGSVWKHTNPFTQLQLIF